MAVNKVIYGGNTLVDLTGDTVTAADLADGVKATGADGNPIVGLMQKVTIDAELSTTSTNPVQNKVIKAELDKKMAKTDKIYEANLEWGGRHIANGFSPVDAGMIPELGANRFAFGNAAGITIEYSTDAGNTWLDYGSSDIAKTALFTTGSNHSIGKSEKGTVTTDCLLRVTIDTDAFRIYTVLNKFAIFISTGSCTGCYCVVEASLENTPTEPVKFVNNASLNGNAGWNIINIANLITYGNAPTYQYGLIRFTFGCTDVGDASVPMTITKIMGFGGVGWNTPSNMAKTGLLYKYNTLQEATFPATVTAPTFIGNLTGTATEATKAQRLALQAGTTNVNRPVIFQDSANYAGELLANRCSTFQYNPATDNLTVGKINGFTIETSVPANAKFTDTVYTHPSTHPASMITGLSTVATSGSYNDLSNKPTIPTKVSALQNDAGYLTQHQSLDGYAKTSGANTWTAEQSLNNVNITYERYTASSVSGTSATPTASTAVYTATGNFNLDLNSIANTLINGQSTVFTAYINANADYALSITNGGTVKYIGKASDVAITSAGLLLNIFMTKDSNGITSIVQASKLS